MESKMEEIYVVGLASRVDDLFYLGIRICHSSSPNQAEAHGLRASKMLIVKGWKKVLYITLGSCWIDW